MSSLAPKANALTQIANAKDTLSMSIKKVDANLNGNPEQDANQNELPEKLLLPFLFLSGLIILAESSTRQQQKQSDQQPEERHLNPQNLPQLKAKGPIIEV